MLFETQSLSLTLLRLTPFFVTVRIAYVEFYTPESVLMALAMSN